MDLWSIWQSWWRDHPPLPGGTWILGVSGGVDSTVLLHLCARHRAEIDPAQAMVVAHMNHGIRGAEADLDTAFVRDLAATLQIACVTRHVDLPKLARTRGGGLEAIGRTERHRFYADLAAVQRPAVVLLAHHADDQIETMVLHHQRGADLPGLAAMKPERTLTLADGRALTLLRPLLEVSKADLYAYADAHAIDWREDASNLNPAFSRNHIRAWLRQRYAQAPNLRARLLQLNQSIADIDDSYDACIRALAKTCFAVTKSEVTWPDPVHQPLPRDWQHRLLQHAAQHLVPAFTLSKKLGQTLQQWMPEATTGAALDMGHNLRLIRDPGGWAVIDGEPPAPLLEKALPLAPPCSIECQTLTITITQETPPPAIPDADRENPYVEWFDADAISSGLVLRPLVPGDRMHPLGAPGTRKMQDILVDNKIPRRDRARCLILEDSTTPLWLWPIRRSERGRMTPGATRALRIAIEPRAP